MINTTCFYFFSPTGGTKKAGEIFCKSISANIKTADLSLRDEEAKEEKGDLMVIAAPVFGGRIPELVTEKLKKIDGKGKKVVTIVVYGNRAYEDALLELNHAVKEQGFQVIASAALIAQHSMAPEVGKGRPDEQDTKEILDFAQKVLDKIESGQDKPVEVPGNYPYKEARSMPAAPISLPSCNQCRRCEKICPTGAISIKDKTVETNTEKCMLCMACTAVCPEHARVLPPPLKERTEQMLGALKAVRRENEFFL